MRTAIAFAATLAVLAAAYVVFVATQGDVRGDVNAPRPAAPAGGSLAIATAAGLLSIQSDDLGSGALFLPDRHAPRVAAFQDGAADAVGAFVEVISRRRSPDTDLEAAARFLSAPQVELGKAVADRNGAAREALRRFNARVGGHGPAVERSAKTLAAMARAAAAMCDAHEQAVRAAAIGGRFGPADPGAETAFFRARGTAYAWARLLSAYGDELPAKTGAPLKSVLADVLRPLEAAAEFEPQVLFDAPPGGIAPNHLERMATNLAAAAAAARRLDKAAEPA
jgi:hypothetical protein